MFLVYASHYHCWNKAINLRSLPDTGAMSFRALMKQVFGRYQNAVKAEQQLAARRAELKAAWEQTPLRDPAVGHAIDKAHSSRVLSRTARLLKSEASQQPDDAIRLAARVLNPRKGDGADFEAIAAKVENITDPPPPWPDWIKRLPNAW